LCFALQGQADKLIGAFVVNRFWKQENAQDCADGGETCLEPEDVAPGAVGHYYAAYYWTCRHS
jgi:hypothetical protein